MDVFKELFASLSPILKQAGFKKKANSYYLEVNKNHGIINFQKSRGNTKEVVSFTINFGIYSDVLGQLFDGHNDKPEVGYCHWRERVGPFMPNPTDDYWWKVSISDDLNKIIPNVLEVVQNSIMPEINKRMSDEGLINCWMNEYSAGTTEIGRFMYLTTLLKAKGDFNVLNQVVEAFMQKPMGKETASLAAEHLKVIGYSKEKE